MKPHSSPCLPTMMDYTPNPGAKIKHLSLLVRYLFKEMKEIANTTRILSSSLPSSECKQAPAEPHGCLRRTNYFPYGFTFHLHPPCSCLRDPLSICQTLPGKKAQLSPFSIFIGKTCCSLCEVLGGICFQFPPSLKCCCHNSPFQDFAVVSGSL
jgi:hypothetical protein